MDAPSSAPPAERSSRHGLALGQAIAGLTLIAAALWLSRHSSEIDLLRFPLCWAGVLAALDGLGRWKQGASALPTLRSWLFAGAGSLAFWDVFELLNLRLENWWYVGVSGDLFASSAFAAISFATVLPAVRLAEAVALPAGVGPLPRLPAKAASSDAVRRSPSVPLLLGLVALFMPLVFPTYAFPLAWLFLWPLTEALLRALPAPGAAAGAVAPSPLESLIAGDRPRLLRLCAIGLLLGLVWESLNWGSARGWVYTVPFFEEWKLFEMSLPGYLGYLPFTLECAAGLALFDRLSLRWSRPAALGAIAALLGVHVGLEATAFPESTLSISPEVVEVPLHARALGATEATLREFAHRSGAMEAPELREARELARLALVAHLGTRNALRLSQAGIRRVRDLAAADLVRLEARLARSGPVPPAPVLRLWKRAARRELQ